MLAPLHDNGAFAPSHALRLGSPAIDSGDANFCDAQRLTVDQRGQLRDAVCDLGSFEYLGPNQENIFNDDFERPGATKIPGTVPSR